ncbi:hypothetical protein NC661_10660 [Aquibacillus koreensis]|uniref:Uncharacterized protein n=1 Tax=Aquibacillus koreensis TaxID=279446 RepID=A0A9X3WJG8_9BACI|nr:hypothetical protein [Aquibacillus koreensis]MCT2538226.1 hypothetical protein [Aquibacillus koreensis]MDC3420830.1 hypothetical protein [Aquibacillus koreensis]
MKKVWQVFLAFFSIIIFTSISLTASSSFGLYPTEVIEKAEVVVLGKYDFSYEEQISDPSSEFSMATRFEVRNVYVGEASEVIIAGYNYFDGGFEQHQSEGGEYLLFLEQRDDVDYLTPVSRTGVVPVMDGKVTDHIDEQSKKVYQRFMDEQANKDTFITYDTKSYIPLGISIGILALISIFIFHKRKQTIKKNT